MTKPSSWLAIFAALLLAAVSLQAGMDRGAQQCAAIVEGSR